MCETEGGSGQGLGWPTRSRQSATRTDSGRPAPTECGWGRRGSGSARRAAALKGPRRPRPRGMLSEAENRCFLQAGRKKGEIEENQPLADLQPRGRAPSRLQVGATAPAAAELGS